MTDLAEAPVATTDATDSFVADKAITTQSTIGFSRKGIRNHSDFKNIAAEDLFERCRKIPEGSKDGSYFIRTKFKDPSKNRSDANTWDTALLLPIDADSTIDPATSEITEGAPDPEAVAEVLKNARWTFLIYPSHSHGIKGNRYRILMTTDRPYNKVELKGLVEQVIQELHSYGVYLNNVKENMVWSQPWYLPRKDASNTSSFRYLENSDFPVNVHSVKKAAEAEPKKPKKPTKNMHDGKLSPIDLYNEQFSVEGELIARATLRSVTSFFTIIQSQVRPE